MSTQQRTVLIIGSIALILGAIGAWFLFSPTPVVAPTPGETPNENNTPTEMRMDRYSCTDDMSFTLLTSEAGDLIFRAHSEGAVDLPLQADVDDTYVHETLSLHFSNALVTLRTYYDGKEYTCQLGTLTPPVTIPSEVVAPETTIRGEVLLEDSATPLSFDEPHVLTVDLQGMTSDGNLASMARIETEITALPTTFAIPESAIAIGGVVGEASLRATIANTKGTILYETAEYTPLLQEGILPVISVKERTK